MAEPRIPGSTRSTISLERLLDSDPPRLAGWAPDSRHAAVAFRTDRHVMITLSVPGRTRSHGWIGGPSLFKDVTNRDIHAKTVIERRSVTSYHGWGPTLRTHREPVFIHVIAEPAALAGAIRQADQVTGDNRVLVKFSAQAFAKSSAGNRYRSRAQTGDFTNDRHARMLRNPSDKISRGIAERIFICDPTPQRGGIVISRRVLPPTGTAILLHACLEIDDARTVRRSPLAHARQTFRVGPCPHSEIRPLQRLALIAAVVFGSLSFTRSESKIAV